MYKLNKLFLAVLLICSFGAYAADKPVAPIAASIDKKLVEPGTHIVYTLTVIGAFDDPQVNVPEFTDFAIISHNQSQGYSYINGKGGINFNLIYEIMPLKPGVFTIKGATLKTRDTEFKTDPITITVTGKSLEEKSKILPYAEKGIDI